MVKDKVRDVWYLCIGFLITGVGCSLVVYCDLGSDAFNVLTQGIASVLEIRVGNAFYLTQGVLLVFIAAVRRRYIGPGTLVGTFLIGFVMNLWSLLLAPLLQSAGFAVRLCFAAAAPVCLGVGNAFARHSGMGQVPNDIVPVILHELVGRLQFRTVRIVHDGFVVAVGYLLGGTFGIGTIFCVLLTGPCIQRASGMLERWRGKRQPEVSPTART